MQRGFTVIELMIIMALLVMVACLAIPQWENAMAHYDLDIAARELAADLRLLQQTTMDSGGIFPVMRFYRVAPYGYYTSLGGRIVNPHRRFPPTVRIASLSGDITFTLLGRPASGAMMTITLVQANGSGVRQVIIEPITGRVRIQ